MSGRRLVLRGLATALALFFFDVGGGVSRLSYLMYIAVIPWSLACLIVLVLAAKKGDEGRDVPTLVVLGSIIAFVVHPLVLGRNVWSSAVRADGIAAEWLRVTGLFTAGWAAALGLGGAAFAYRAWRRDFRQAPVVAQRLAVAGAVLGGVAFPMAPAALLALGRDYGPGVVPYATAVVSAVLFGSALRGPRIASGEPLRRTLLIAGTGLLLVVAACSLSLPPTTGESRWASPIWSLFAVRHLGIAFAALAVAWIGFALASARAARRLFRPA